MTDLIVKGRGLGGTSASVYIDVFDSRTSSQVEDIERRVTEEARRRGGLASRSVKVHVRRIAGDAEAPSRENVGSVVADREGICVTGFEVDGRRITVRIAVDDGAGDPETVLRDAESRLQNEFPMHELEVVIDDGASALRSEDPRRWMLFGPVRF